MVAALRAAAGACEDAAGGGDRVARDREVLAWARSRLSGVAIACRQLPAVLGTDPTLATEPAEATAGEAQQAQPGSADVLP
ncbi:hypothetical protein [Amycolatopsis australiensis]|uniref:Uncharacterized protein n=1 Tax=Amycolatopsis australiensis TaxID=546364 RepID=A0A1K1SVW3_9PSEU|nr:hypothetical protein [Amycolatopsis australiensis]SFW88372.1 hypothetical protein SAMN04489730_6941 [Amycolatopsis australiensis]